MTQLDKKIIPSVILIILSMMIIYSSVAVKIIGGLIIIAYILFIMSHVMLAFPLIAMFTVISDLVDNVITQKKSKIMHGLLVLVVFSPVALILYIVVPTIGGMMISGETNFIIGLHDFFNKWK